MYCRKCYAKLDPKTESHCPTCGRAFEVSDSRTWSARPFPGVGKVIVQIIATTILGAAAAYVVALHQAAGASGH